MGHRIRASMSTSGRGSAWCSVCGGVACVGVGGVDLHCGQSRYAHCIWFFASLSRHHRRGDCIAAWMVHLHSGCVSGLPSTFHFPRSTVVVSIASARAASIQTVHRSASPAPHPRQRPRNTTADHSVRHGTNFVPVSLCRRRRRDATLPNHSGTPPRRTLTRPHAHPTHRPLRRLPTHPLCPPGLYFYQQALFVHGPPQLGPRR